MAELQQVIVAVFCFSHEFRHKVAFEQMKSDEMRFQYWHMVWPWWQQKKTHIAYSVKFSWIGVNSMWDTWKKSYILCALVSCCTLCCHYCILCKQTSIFFLFLPSYLRSVFSLSLVFPPFEILTKLVKTRKHFSFGRVFFFRRVSLCYKFIPAWH